MSPKLACSAGCGLGGPRFALLLSGDARDAAAAWSELGCVYEAADALAASNDVADLREALDQLTVLGARLRARFRSRAGSASSGARRPKGAESDDAFEPSRSDEARDRGCRPHRQWVGKRRDRSAANASP